MSWHSKVFSTLRKEEEGEGEGGVFKKRIFALLFKNTSIHTSSMKEKKSSTQNWTNWPKGAAQSMPEPSGTVFFKPETCASQMIPVILPYQPYLNMAQGSYDWINKEVCA